MECKWAEEAEYRYLTQARPRFLTAVSQVRPAAKVRGNRALWAFSYSGKESFSFSIRWDGKQPPHRLKFAQNVLKPRPQQFSRSILPRFTIALRFLRASKTVALGAEIAVR